MTERRDEANFQVELTVSQGVSNLKFEAHCLTLAASPVQWWPGIGGPTKLSSFLDFS